MVAPGYGVCVCLICPTPAPVPLDSRALILVCQCLLYIPQGAPIPPPPPRGAGLHYVGFRRYKKWPHLHTCILQLIVVGVCFVGFSLYYLLLHLFGVPMVERISMLLSSLHPCRGEFRGGTDVGYGPITTLFLILFQVPAQ